MRKTLLVVLCCVLAFTVAAQDLKTISVASDEWEDCTEKDGSGIYFDILRLVFAGSNLDIKIVPFARSVQMVDTARVDISVGNYEGDVSKALFPQYPIDFDDVTVLMTKTVAATYKGEASLKNKKVAWITDYGYEDYIEVPVTMVQVSDRNSGINMLRSGRVDYYVETNEEILSALEELNLSETDFRLDSIKQLPLYVCFADNAKGSKLRDTWNQRIPRLIASGELKALYDQWDFSDSYELLIQKP